MRRSLTAVALASLICSLAFSAFAGEPAQLPAEATRPADALDSVLLSDGGLLRGVVLSTDATSVTIRLRSGEERRVPSSQIRTVNHWAPAPVVAAPELEARSEGEPVELPAGHFYLGLGISSITLPRGSQWNLDNSVSPSGGVDSGFTLGINASVELERLLFIMTAEVGPGGNGLLSRAGLLAGYTLTQQSSPPYLALGFSGFAKSFGFGDDPVAASNLGGFTVEAGWLIGRSHRFGRVTLAATAVVPFPTSAGVWTPWLALGLRFQL